MINLDNQTIIHEDKIYPIQSFQVWWLGPLGFVPTLATAQAIHKSLQIEDAPFNVVWKAIPVAVAENGVYEEFH